MNVMLKPQARLLAAIVLTIASIAACAGEKTVRLLTIGNSFSQNATTFLPEIVKAAGHTLVFKQATFGGASLAQHWERVERAEKDPTDEKALYNGKSLKQILEAEPFDVITIQQYSLRSHDRSTYRPFARHLVDLIKKIQPKAEIVVHQTWAYRVDDPRFTKKPAKPDEPDTQKAMYEGLTQAYESLAAELGTRIIPSGDAFYLADTDPAWGFKPEADFDPKKAEPPAAPSEKHSLHAGYKWSKGKDGKQTLAYDGHHASVAGQYLGACAYFEVLFGESVVGNGFVPKSLDAEDARYLQETVHKAVEKRKAPK